MEEGFRPMLAAKCGDISDLRFPVIASPKVDGIRCVIINGVPHSRSLKPIRNRFVQRYFGEHSTNWPLDGELVVGDNFQYTTSGIMSFAGEPDFSYWIFDLVDTELTYVERLNVLNLAIGSLPGRFTMLPFQSIGNAYELKCYEQACLEMGLEGVCLRTPDSPYKYGRSTLKEQWLVKLKQFEDCECIIIGFNELMHNENVPDISALGYQERSTHRENMVPGDALGSLRVRALAGTYEGAEFNVGTGFSEEMRRQIWGMRDLYEGWTVTVRYQPHGSKDVPRIPVFKGFRHNEDGI